MALDITPIQRKSIQDRTVVYDPVYVNDMTPNNTKGSYVLFYVFSESPKLDKLAAYSGNSCIVEFLNKISKGADHTFIKIGNFANGAKSRWNSNKGDLIKIDGNRSPAARHSQDVLIEYPDLYLHFMMVVVSEDTVEKNLEEALRGIVAVSNKQERVAAPPGKWRTPVSLARKAMLSKKTSEKINSKLKA